MFCFVLSVGGVRGVKLSVWGVYVWCVLLVVSVECESCAVCSAK